MDRLVSCMQDWKGMTHIIAMNPNTTVELLHCKRLVSPAPDSEGEIGGTGSGNIAALFVSLFRGSSRTCMLSPELRFAITCQAPWVVLKLGYIFRLFTWLW
jgi:hypothetical protein